MAGVPDDEALRFDREHLWHPYTSMHEPLPVYPVAGASGVHIELADGRKLIDGMSSWWCVIHGYNHPKLNAAAQAQLEVGAHVMFGGLTHGPAVELGRKLIHMSPKPLQRLFYCDSGSVAVEVAIKMALQYWQARGEPKRQRLMSLRGGYHGDTFGAMSVCDPDAGMHSLFRGVLPQHLFAPLPEPSFDGPWDPRASADLEALFATHHQELAALILEPIVQGAGGMRFYHPTYLQRARELCDEHGVLLIADEIATGFGRSGRLWGCDHAGITPDIMCLGKALTGGYLSLAATLATADVADTISAGPAGGTFMHGPTFMANPLACSVALASLELLTSGGWQDRVLAIEAQLKGELASCAGMASVRDARVLGAIGVLEMEQAIDVAAAQASFVERGVWLRPFGRLLYAMPPYVMDSAALSQVTAAMVDYARNA